MRSYLPEIKHEHITFGRFFLQIKQECKIHQRIWIYGYAYVCWLRIYTVIRSYLPEMFRRGTLIWWNDASFRNFHLTKMFSKEPCAMDYLKILPQYDIFQRNIVQDRVLWIRLEILILPRKTTIEWCVISNLPTLTKIFDVTLVQPWKSELGEYSYKKVQWGSE